MKRIYVASSWRNDIQPSVVRELRDAGHEVYDFKQPQWKDNGFHWSEIDNGWQSWTFEQYIDALGSELAEDGFKSDMDALNWCDTCVLVLPCGRSAHLELGYAVGQGKTTIVLHDASRPVEPELMNKMCDAQFDRIDDVIAFLRPVASDAANAL